MADEARLEDVGSGLAPVSEGWFVVNVRDAAWLTNDAFGARCVFEASGPVLRERADLEQQRFSDLGCTLACEPVKPFYVNAKLVNRGNNSQMELL